MCALASIQDTVNKLALKCAKLENNKCKESVKDLFDDANIEQIITNWITYIKNDIETCAKNTKKNNKLYVSDINYIIHKIIYKGLKNVKTKYFNKCKLYLYILKELSENYEKQFNDIIKMLNDEIKSIDKLDKDCTISNVFKFESFNYDTYNAFKKNFEGVLTQFKKINELVSKKDDQSKKDKHEEGKIEVKPSVLTEAKTKCLKLNYKDITIDTKKHIPPKDLICDQMKYKIDCISEYKHIYFRTVLYSRYNSKKDEFPIYSIEGIADGYKLKQKITDDGDVLNIFKHRFINGNAFPCDDNYIPYGSIINISRNYPKIEYKYKDKDKTKTIYITPTIDISFAPIGVKNLRFDEENKIDIDVLYIQPQLPKSRGDSVIIVFLTDKNTYDEVIKDENEKYNIDLINSGFTDLIHSGFALNDFYTKYTKWNYSINYPPILAMRESDYAKFNEIMESKDYEKPTNSGNYEAVYNDDIGAYVFTEKSDTKKTDKDYITTTKVDYSDRVVLNRKNKNGEYEPLELTKSSKGYQSAYGKEKDMRVKKQFTAINTYSNYCGFRIYMNSNDGFYVIFSLEDLDHKYLKKLNIDIDESNDIVKQSLKGYKSIAKKDIQKIVKEENAIKAEYIKFALLAYKTIENDKIKTNMLLPYCSTIYSNSKSIEYRSGIEYFNDKHDKHGKHGKHGKHDKHGKGKKSESEDED